MPVSTPRTTSEATASRCRAASEQLRVTPSTPLAKRTLWRTVVGRGGGTVERTRHHRGPARPGSVGDGRQAQSTNPSACEAAMEPTAAAARSARRDRIGSCGNPSAPVAYSTPSIALAPASPRWASACSDTTARARSWADAEALASTPAMMPVDRFPRPSHPSPPAFGASPSPKNPHAALAAWIGVSSARRRPEAPHARPGGHSPRSCR